MFKSYGSSYQSEEITYKTSHVGDAAVTEYERTAG